MQDVEQAKEAEEDTSIPSKLMLTLKHVDDDSQELGSFVIGDIERNDEAHKGDTGTPPLAQRNSFVVVPCR